MLAEEILDFEVGQNQLFSQHSDLRDLVLGLGHTASLNHLCLHNTFRWNQLPVIYWEHTLYCAWWCLWQSTV